MTQQIEIRQLEVLCSIANGIQPDSVDTSTLTIMTNIDLIHTTFNPFKYVLTKRGLEYLNFILQIPLPENKWVVPEFDKQKFLDHI